MMTSSFPASLDNLLNKSAASTESNVDVTNTVEDTIQVQLEQLGPEPTLLQAVTVLLKQSAKAESEARQARKQLERDVV